MSLSVTENITQLEVSDVVFLINKRLYFEGIKYDFYRKCLLPKDLSRPEDDYRDITMVGRSLPILMTTSKRNRKCGSYYGSYICECEEARKSKMNYCYKPSCKICFHKGITRQVKRIVERLEKIEGLEGERFELAHYSFNIIEKDKKGKVLFPIIDIDSFKRYKAKLNRILKKYNMDGVLIFHPYRKDFRLIYKGVQAVKKSPHFHFIGRGNIIDGGSFYRKHGFTYRNITYDQWKKGKRDNPYLEGMDNVRGVFKYTLSHSAVLSPRMKSYSYLGKFSGYWYSKINKVREFVPVVCDECGDNLHFIKKVVKKMVDGLICEISAFKIKKNVGKDFRDLYVYDRSLMVVEEDHVLERLIESYDLIYRNFKTKKKKVKKIIE